MNYRMSISAFALAAFMGVFTSNANASCGGGLIEVKDNGVESCVTPEVFATLSDAVKATADPEDVQEAISGEEDETEDDVDGVDESPEDSLDDSTDDSSDDSSDDSTDDSSDDSSDDSNDGPDDSGSDDSGPDSDSSDDGSDDD